MYLNVFLYSFIKKNGDFFIQYVYLYAVLYLEVSLHKHYLINLLNLSYQLTIQFSSVAQSCPTLCNPKDCTTPGLPVHHQFLELAQTHVHWVGDAIQQSHPLSICFSSQLQSFRASGSFPMSWFFTTGGKSTGVSALASVLPMDIQDWFPLGWTGWISLQSKELSKVFSNTTVQKHLFFGPQLSYSPTLNPYLTTGKTIALTRQTFDAKVMSLLFIFNINVFILMGG